MSDNSTTASEQMDSGYLFRTPSELSAAHASVVDSVYRTADDEQVVNTALVVFLIAITANCLQVKLEWRISRARFVVDLGDAHFEARTDGQLRAKDSDTIYAIIEVKPFVRSEKSNAIHIQEEPR